jgi:hypothetical protein
MTAKQVMRRKAADNVYLHKDFHGAMNQALVYLEEHFGAEAVREYLRQFARAFYSPLTRRLKDEGLEALKEYFAAIYKLEGAECRIELSADKLVLTVPRCPAVMHIRRMSLPLSPHFIEATRTVNEAICEGTPFAAELLHYDPTTGRSVQRFTRRRL